MHIRQWKPFRTGIGNMLFSRNIKQNEKAKEYRCVKPFALDRIDEDGFAVWGYPVIIERGTIFTKCDAPLVVAVAPAVRLENANGMWIEIHPDTLELHFEEVAVHGSPAK